MSAARDRGLTGTDDPFAARREQAVRGVVAPTAPAPVDNDDEDTGDAAEQPVAPPRKRRSGGRQSTRGRSDTEAPKALPMPPKRQRGVRRVQLNTRVTIGTLDRLDAFVDREGTTTQETVEMAISEFLTARGA